MEFPVLNDNNIYDNMVIVHEMVRIGLNGSYVSHELIFINYLYKAEIKKDSSIALKFMMFALQFYPSYVWTKYDFNNPLSSVMIECALSDYILRYENMINAEQSYEQITKAMFFGEMVTDFLIRFRGYSLVKCQNQNIIITAHSNCDKRFSDYLHQGYALQRKAKIVYNPLDEYQQELYPFIDGYFTYLPVLPTKDIGYDIDEIIETEKRKYVRICDK